MGIIIKIIIFLVSAHSETVEKLEKIYIKLNLNKKNSNFRMDSIFAGNSENFRALGTFLGFHTKTVGVTHSHLMTFAYFWLLYPNLAFIFVKK